MSNQAGVSLHAANDVMINSDMESGSDKGGSNTSTGRCFYTLCEKNKICGVIPCGKFKDRKHAQYCCMFTAMMACLLIAIIGPLVSTCSRNYWRLTYIVIFIFSFQLNFFCPSLPVVSECPSERRDQPGGRDRLNQRSQLRRLAEQRIWRWCRGEPLRFDYFSAFMVVLVLFKIYICLIIWIFDY